MAGFGFNTGLDGHRLVPLTEEESEEVAQGIKEIYRRAGERMLTTTARRFSRGITQPGWAERKASEVLAAHEQLRHDLERAGKERESLLRDVMTRGYVSGSQRFYAQMGAVLGPVQHISPNAMKAGYILADLNNNLNTAERRILRQFDDSYANIIGAVSAEMATGVTNTREAVGNALRAFADQGITSFVDRGGHRWTLENYAEMAVLTAIERSTISGYTDTMQSYGYDLAVIDGHAGACPICAAWEGVIVSVSGDNPDYPSLLDAENDGCFHPRCLHGISTYYPGISREPEGGFRNEPREIEQPSRQYTARSKQRYMERQIRKYKDRAIVAQTRLQKAQALEFVRRWEQQLDQLIDDQPEDDYLYRHKGRETSEFGKRFADVSDSYVDGYTPGAGKISKEPGYSDPTKGHETTIAEGLRKSIGGDVMLINNKGNVSKPDLEWHGKSWEIKSTSSVTSIDTQVRKGLGQIATYHGNLIIDNSGTDFDTFQRTAIERIQRSAKENFDVAFFHNSEFVKILRYEKR